MNDAQAYNELFKFLEALTIVNSEPIVIGMGLFGALGWGKGRDEYEDLIREANETLVEGASDADKANKIEDRTGEDIRDKVSTEDIENYAEEARLLGWGHRRN